MMLILSRRLGERLFIGDDVKITVLGISGNNVRLGIEAPKNVAVMREELYNRGVRRVNPEGNHIDDKTEE